MSFKLSLEDNLSCTKVVLENGITVLANDDLMGECGGLCYLVITINTGSNQEPPDKRGIAHLYEHLSFRLKLSENQKCYYNEMNKLGADFGASTTYDTIKFYSKFPNENLKKILELESLRFGNVSRNINNDDIKKEVEIIRNERNQSVVSYPTKSVEELMLKSLYEPVHPMYVGIIGQFNHLSSVTKEDLMQFEKRYISPANTYISVLSNLDLESVIALIRKYFCRSEPQIRHFFYKNERLSSGIMICSQGAGKYSKDWLIINFILKYLLLEKKIASFEHRGSLEFGYYFVTIYKQNQQDSYNEYLKMIDNLILESIPQDKYRIVKDLIIKEFQAHQNPWATLSEQATINIVRGELSYKNLIELTRAITKEDIDSVLRRYFKNIYHSTISIVKDGGEADAIKGAVELFNSSDWISKEIQESRDISAELPNNKPDAQTVSELNTLEIPELINGTPPVWKFKMTNGIRVLGTTLESTKIIEGTIYILVNRDAEKTGLSGINLYCTESLKGTKQLTFDMFENKVKELSSGVNVKCFPEYVAINFKTSRNYAKPLFALIEEAILTPRINKSSVCKQKEQFIHFDKSTGFDHFSNSYSLFPYLALGLNHNYSRHPFGKSQDKKNITAFSVQSHYKKFFKPDIAKICITGDIDKEFCKDLLSSLNNNWTGKHAKFPNPTKPQPQPKNKLYFYDSPGGDNILISFFGITPSWTEKDNYLLTLANTMLGDLHGSSLLFKRLREEEGLAYAINSQVYTIGNYRYFYAAATSNTVNSVKVFNKMKETIFSFADKFDSGMMNKTLHHTVNYRNSRLYNPERQLFVLSVMALNNIKYHYDLWRDSILKSVTIEDIKEVSRKYLNQDNLYCLLIGSKSKLLPILKELDYGEVVEICQFNS